MTPVIANLPLRQKIILSLTIIAGLFILLACNISIINKQALDATLLFYGMSVPFLLLGFDTLIDLDNKIVFNIWGTIALIFLIIYFITKDSTNFVIQRSTQHSTGINKFISDSWTSSFKALPIFLICYFIFNFIVKKKTGNYIVNTFKQSTWYNDAAQRKIYWYDVLTTFTLLAIIVCSSIFEF